ncbi:MAG: hypothetical protein JSV03_01855, partial [Planctomycetota bacterium]
MKNKRSNMAYVGRVLPVLLIMCFFAGLWSSPSFGAPKAQTPEERKKALDAARARRERLAAQRRTQKQTGGPTATRPASTTRPAPVTRRPVTSRRPEADPSKMKIDANKLKDVTDEELKKLEEQARASAKKPKPAPRAVPTKAPSTPSKDAPDLKKLEPGWWQLPPEDRPYFFSWKDASFDQICQDLEEMSGLSMVGLSTMDTKPAKKISFQSVKLMTYDEALTTFNIIISEMDFWVVRRGSYLVIRKMTEWYRHIPPERAYNTVEQYKKAKLPLWEVASVVYQPKEASADWLATVAVDKVPLNSARATIIPNSNLIELRGFVYYIEQQLEFIRGNEFQGGDGRELKVYTLKHASPSDASTMLYALLPDSGGVTPTAVAPRVQPSRTSRTTRTPAPPPQPAISGVGMSTADSVDIREDTRLNRLLVRASPAKHKLVQELLETYIDIPSGAKDRGELIRLEHADPNEVVNIVKQMLGEMRMVQPPAPAVKRGQPPKPPPPARMQKEPTTAVLQPVPKMRAILVKAEPDEMEEIKGYIKDLDVPEEESTYKYVILQHAQGSSVASTFSSVFGADPRSRRSDGRQFRALADQSNPKGLVISAIDVKQLEEVMGMVEELDVDPNQGAQEHVVTLKYSTPSTLSRLLSERYAAGGGGYSRYSAASGLPKFMSEDSSKTLVILCKEENWPEIEKLIKKIEEEGYVEKTTKAYQIKNTSASTVYSALNQFYSSSFPRGRYGDPAMPSVSYDTKNNAVIVTATKEWHEKTAEAIAAMDVESKPTSTKVYRLKHASASSVYSAVYNTFYRVASSMGAAFYTTYDTTNNYVVVTATDDIQEKVIKMIAEMDVEGQTADTKIYQINNTSASSVYSAVYNGLYRLASTKGAPFSVNYDTTSNKVVVITTEEFQEKAAKIITEMDVQDPKAVASPKTYKLENATAYSVYSAVYNAFYTLARTKNAPFAVNYDTTTNTVVVTTTQEYQEKAAQLIAEMDVEGQTADTKTYQIKNTSASSVYSAVYNGLYRLASTKNAPFSVNYDTTSNKVVVTTTEEFQEKAAKIITEMDVQDPDAVASPKTYQLKSATASSVYTAVYNAFYTLARTKNAPFSVNYDTTTNTVIVTTTQEYQEKAAQLIAEMDIPGEEVLTQVYQLKYAQASTASSAINYGFRDGARKSGSAFNVTYDSTGNSVIVTATQEYQDKAAQLVAELDKPGPADEAEFRAIALENADPEYVAEKLEELFAESRYSYRYGGSQKTPFRVVPESVSSRVLVSSSEEDFTKAETLAKQIDQEYAAKEYIRKTFILKYMEGRELENVIEALYQEDRYRSSRTSSPGDVRVQDFDKGIVVFAPKDKMDEIEEVIAQLDTDPTKDNEVRTYMVETTDYYGTYYLARNLREMFGGDRYGRSSTSPVKFFGEYGSNMLIVSAPSTRMEEIDEMVKKMLESRQGEDMTLVIKHYDIKQARPSDVADMVQPILETKYQELQQKSGSSRSRFYGGYGS